MGFDVDDIKPVGVIVAAALSLLAAGKSLKGSKAITAAKLSKPEWFYEDVSLKVRPPCCPPVAIQHQELAYKLRSKISEGCR